MNKQEKKGGRGPNLIQLQVRDASFLYEFKNGAGKVKSNESHRESKRFGSEDNPETH